MKLLIVLAFFIFAGLAFGQDVHLDAARYHAELNKNFADSLKSPLEKSDRLNFKGLDFFEIDSAYIVVAKLERTPNDKPFKMATTTDRRPSYKRYGILHFKIEGKEFQLDVFQNAERVKINTRSLFLPFTDNTSGDQSYGGGRYIELEAPNGDQIVLDFNKAYNPYCVYNRKYSCPIVPAQNHLNVEIRAGVKKFDH